MIRIKASDSQEIGQPIDCKIISYYVFISIRRTRFTFIANKKMHPRKKMKEQKQLSASRKLTAMDHLQPSSYHPHCQCRQPAISSRIYPTHP